MCLFALFLLKSAHADNIVIGMSAAFTGPSESLGIELYRGVMTYLEHINRQGGIYGKRIVIKAYDDGYNPIPAIENTIKLIENDNVFLLFSYVGTPTVTRVLPLLKIYSDRFAHLFFPFTGAQPQREPPYDQFVFNLRASYRQETEGLVDNFIALGRQRIGVFYQADAYGRSGWDGVRRALAKHGLTMAGEATYRRGTDYAQSLRQQVEILKAARPEAIVSIGAYAACAAFIRDARDAGWQVPIANVSFVGSERLLSLLLQSGKRTGKNYTVDLINSQVVPSYADTSLAAVRTYRNLIDRYNPMPPRQLVNGAYKPLRYSFVSFEGYLNAKLLVEILRRMGRVPEQARIKEVVEAIHNAPVSFGRHRHQGLNRIYYTMVEQGEFVPLTTWERWKK
jgi:ABC-type branched-subunit amino acid transport system substrate-binding protein